MNIQNVLDAALSANATTLGTGDASQIFRTGFNNSVKVHVNLKQPERNWLTKNTSFPLVFLNDKTISNDHQLLCAMREVIRETFEANVGISRTRVRTLIVGASQREISKYASNPHVHYYVYGKENKDYDRIVRPALQAISERLYKKAAKSNKTAYLPKEAEMDTTKLRPVVKRYYDYQTLFDDYMSLHKLPATIHLEPIESDVLIFEDSIYNFTPKMLVELFRTTNASMAYGYGIFPMELLFPELPANSIYHFDKFRCWEVCEHLKNSVHKFMGEEVDDYVCETCGLSNMRAKVTFKNGYCNGYEHDYNAWRTILTSPIITYDGFSIGVEIQTRVGCMLSFKLFKCRYSENVVRTIELNDYEKYVRVLDAWASVDHRTCRMKKSLVYFSVRERELLEVWDFVMGLDPKSLTVQNAVTQIKRKMGGIYIATKDLTDKWELPMQYVYPLAVAVIMNAKLMTEKMDLVMERSNPTSIYEDLIKVMRTIGYYATYPVQKLIELLFHEHLTDKIFMWPTNGGMLHQRALVRTQSAQRVPEIVASLTMDNPNEEDTPTCPFCAQIKDQIGVQIIVCEHKMDSQVEWKLTLEQIRTLENTLIDDDMDPEGLRSVKKRAKQAMPKTAISYTCRTEYVCGPPGTGKSSLARMIGNPSNTLIWSPFTKLRKDYVGVKKGDEEVTFDFQTVHRAVATSGHKVVIVDEFTSADYAMLACCVYNNRPDIVYIIGDEKQTKIKEPEEGLYIPNHIPNFRDLSKHRLRVNFRNAIDVVAMMNHVYGYDMIPACFLDPKIPRVDRSVWVEDTSVESKPEAATQMCFTHASAESWLENKSLTVRSYQGSTVDKAVLYATRLDADRPMIDELAIVALTRHRQKLIIRVHECDESKNFLSKIGYSSEQTYQDFLKTMTQYIQLPDGKVNKELVDETEFNNIVQPITIAVDKAVVVQIQERPIEEVREDPLLMMEEGRILVELARPDPPVVLPQQQPLQQVQKKEEDPQPRVERIIRYMSGLKSFEKVLTSDSFGHLFNDIVFTHGAYRKAEFKQQVVEVIKNNASLDDAEVYRAITLVHPTYNFPYNLTRAGKRFADVCELVGLKGVKRYLDVGTNDGSIFETFQTRLKLQLEDTFVSDLEDKRVRKLQTTFIKPVTLEAYDVISNDFLDLVTMFMVLHHVNDIPNLLIKINQKMRDGAILVVREHDVDPATDLATVLNIYHGFNEYIWTANPIVNIPHAYGHYKQRRDWIALVECFGFKLESQKLMKDKFSTVYLVFRKVSVKEDRKAILVFEEEEDEDHDDTPKQPEKQQWIPKQPQVVQPMNEGKMEVSGGASLTYESSPTDSISTHSEYVVKHDGSGNNYQRKFDALPSEQIVRKSEYIQHLQEMVPFPLMDTKELPDRNDKRFGQITIDAPKLEHPCKDSHLYLKHPFVPSMSDADTSANNELSSCVVVGQFRDCRTNADDLVMPVNQRGHVKNLNWEFLAIGPGAGTRYTDKNPYQELNVMGQRYNNPKPAKPFNDDARKLANKLVELYYAECKQEDYKLEFDEANIARKVDEFLQSAAVKHYYAQFGGFEYREVASRIRFHLKTIYKPSNTMKDSNMFKAGQGISAWNPDLLIYFCLAFRILAEHDRMTERKDEHVKVFTDNGLNTFEFIEQVRNAVKRLGDLPYKHGILDQEMFDSLQNEWSQYLETAYWKKMGVSEEFLEMYYQFRHHAVMLGLYSWCKIEYEKLSGEPGTLVNNGIVEKTVGNAVLRGCGPVVLIYKGDDLDKMQMDLEIDEELLIELKSFTVMRLRAHITDRGEFCGFIMNGSDVVPNIVRKMDKIIAKPYRDYKQFTIYQQSLRDYETELRLATKSKVIGCAMDLYGLAETECERIFDAVISMGHINEAQFQELVVKKQMLVGVPQYNETCYMNTQVVF